MSVQSAIYSSDIISQSDYIKDVPKDYRPVARTVEDTRRQYDGVGYETDGHAEAVCDARRLHYEHDPIRPKWRTIVPDTCEAKQTYKVDKALTSWLGVATKCARINKHSSCPVQLHPDALRVQREWAQFAEVAEAAFLRPLEAPPYWVERFGLRPQFMAEAIAYVTRGEACEITVTFHDNKLVGFHNCTRHAYVMPQLLQH